MGSPASISGDASSAPISVLPTSMPKGKFDVYQELQHQIPSLARGLEPPRHHQAAPSLEQRMAYTQENNNEICLLR
jgi:hypothetical protein